MSVYFVQADSSDGYVKIGYSKDYGKRLIDLQISSPYKLTLIALLPGSKVDEGITHEKFSVYRIRGEWFYPNKHMYDYLYESKSLYSETIFLEKFHHCDFSIDMLLNNNSINSVDELESYKTKKREKLSPIEAVLAVTKHPDHEEIVCGILMSHSLQKIAHTINNRYNPITEKQFILSLSTLETFKYYFNLFDN